VFRQTRYIAYLSITGKVFRIGTVRYNWPMSAHASQAFSIVHCTDLEDLPITALTLTLTLTLLFLMFRVKVELYLFTVIFAFFLTFKFLYFYCAKQ